MWRLFQDFFSLPKIQIFLDARNQKVEKSPCSLDLLTNISNYIPRSLL